MIKYTKYEKLGVVHWKWYSKSNNNIGYKVLVDKSLEYFSGQGTVIDIGCGDGLPAYLLAKKGFTVIGIEPEIAGLKVARDKSKHLDFVGYETTIEKFVKENNQTFDYLYSLNTIEHVDDPDVFVEMMKRIKNFGIIITDDKDSKLRRHSSHVKEFNRDSLKALFKDFKIEDINFGNTWVDKYFIGIKIQ